MLNIFKKSFSVFKKALSYWTKMRSPRRAAALSYYAIFSIGPLLLIITYLAQQISSLVTIESTIDVVGNFVNPAILPAIKTMLISLADVSFSPTILVVGIVLFVIGALAVLRELQHSIGEMLEPEKEHTGFKKMIFRYLIGFVILIIFCGLIAFMTGAHLFFALESNITFFTLSNRALQIFLIFIATLVMTTAFFQIATLKKTPWNSIGIGACITAILFTLGQIFISYFITHLSASLSAASSFVILATWIYYSGLVFFYGVAITYVLQKDKDGSYINSF